MAQKLDANLNVIQETPIELELINGDLSIISKLDDEPNDVGGLTSTQLKAKFDEAGNIIKEYLNESLIPAVLAADATEATRSAAEAERVENELERVANENVRVPAETARIAAENIRIENEATRVENEEERIAAEATRKANEAQRIINENAREDLETGYVARAEAAAKRAEDAAADAENTVGGDYITQEEAQELVDKAEADANSYTDKKVAAIPAPDVYTKAETLADETKTGWGLPTSAVPDDVFGWFVKATWSVKERIRTLNYSNVQEANPWTGANGNVTGTVYYSSQVNIAVDGTVSLVNKLSISGKGTEYANFNVIKGHFWQRSGFSTIWWTEADAADISYGGGQGGGWMKIQAKEVTGVITYEARADVNSYDRNAYPDDGYVGEFHYTYKGRYLDNITNPANTKIATGSYNGTGTYGSSNPNSLTFDFVPKLVIVTSQYGLNPSTGFWQDGFVWIYSLQWEYVGSNSSYEHFAQAGNALSWYSDKSAAYQQNTSGSTYYYIAIG